MGAQISITTAGQLVDALENWIIDNKCNPSTPEEWARCIEDLTKSGAITSLGVLEDKDVPVFKEQLKEHLNVEELENGNS